MIFVILLCLGMAVGVYILGLVWTFIHEMSHVVAVKLTSGLHWYRMRLYPHKLNGEDCGASVTYLPKRVIKPKEQAIISMAPFVPSLLASVLCPVAIFMSGWVAVAWFLFWFIGVCDLVSEVSASTKNSDIMNAARNLKLNIWKLRILGLAVIPTIVTLSMVLHNVIKYI